MNLNLRILGKEVLGFGLNERSNIGDLKNPPDWMVKMLGGRNVAGVSVNEYTALNFSGYYGAVKILSETMGILPGDVYFQDKDKKEPNLAHPVAKILFNKPNSYQTPQLFHETLMTYACNKGNGYGLILRDSKYRPGEIIVPENQGDIQPFLYNEELFYNVKGMSSPVPPRDIFHIRGLSFNGYVGMSLIEAAVKYIAGGIAAQDYSNDIFENGGSERAALVVPGKIDAEVEERIKASWRDKYGKNAKYRNDVGVLQGGVDVKNIGINPGDAQLIDSKKISIEDFSRYSRVPLHMLQHFQNSAGYNSLEQLSKEFVVYTMRPWIVRFVQEAQSKLLREDEKGKYFVRYYDNTLISSDSAAMAELVSKMFPTGALNPDEIRDIVFNLNPRSDGGGGTYYTAVNVHSDEHAKLKQDEIKNKIKSDNNGAQDI